MSSLTDRLHEFHAEVLRLRARVSRRFAMPGDEDTGTESPRNVLRKLTEILEKQELDAKRKGGDVGLRIYKQAQFAMAALADEIFLTLDWPGRDLWRDELLEARLFGSQRAGELLFERINAMDAREESSTELARVYLIVLALGFQGRYRDEIDAELILEDYRRRLFRFIYQRDPLATRGAETVMPKAYESTASDAQRAKQLPYLRPWILGIVLLLAFWIGSSYAVFKYETNELVPLIDDLAATKSQGAGQ